MLFVLLVSLAFHARLISGRDVILDSAPILALRRADPDAAVGHAPHHHARPLLRGYRVHTLLCRGSGLPRLGLAAARACRGPGFPPLGLAAARASRRPRLPRVLLLPSPPPPHSPLPQ